MKTKTKATTLAVALALASAPIFAGDGGGLVDQILVHSHGGNGQGVLMFTTENNVNKAECGQSIPTAWAVSLDTQSGQAMFATLLAAQSQNKQVIVKGEGDCLDWGDRERPMYIVISR